MRCHIVIMALGCVSLKRLGFIMEHIQCQNPQPGVKLQNLLKATLQNSSL